MVRYAKYAKGYNLFDPSSHKRFIERSVQFEEEPMQEIELVKGVCSHPPLHDEVRDDYLSDSDVDDDDGDMHSDHDSPIRPKWAKKTIQATGDLVGDPVDTRKTRSQFHNAFSTCDSHIPERCFMIVRYYPY